MLARCTVMVSFWVIWREREIRDVCEREGVGAGALWEMAPFCHFYGHRFPQNSELLLACYCLDCNVSVVYLL